MIDTRQMRASGFSASQIARLKELRAMYPLVELIRSRREMNAPQFIRWRYRQGLIHG